ncbi:rab proteins geranylgeranyltransferase component A 2-like [Diadema antillarum]|uniref:rab proteins geranylgeranyltransferase component A 2-like n=1 Tax=Diadema antillarum TaxID=105358 RepID=UPI003A86CBB6
MAADELPTEYDDIVVGTGVQESILAAALARVGRQVLHLDRNDYYSGEWASFHLKSMLDWIDKTKSSEEASAGDGAATNATSPDSSTATLQEGERLVGMQPYHGTISNLVITKHVKEKPDEVIPLPESPPAASNETVDTSQAAQVHDPTVSGTQQTDHHSAEEEVSATEQAANVSCENSPQGEEAEDASGRIETETTSPEASSARGDGSEATPDDNQSTSDQQSHDPASVERRTGDESEVDAETEAATEAAASTDQGQARASENTPEGSGQQPEQVVSPPVEVGRKEWTWEGISKEWRKFNIDLSPKLMFCRGSMVELLVSSRISRYAEFKAVTRILTHINGKLEQVPCSRADVFSSRYVSVLEKRMLMRVIEFCLDHENRQDEYRDFIDKPFVDFLKSRKLTTTLQHFVIHSIAMVTAETPTQEALKAMQYFLRSLGRYGNTAFLWTMYGSGELPQCFCRMCAVFGGIYVLRTGVRGMITDAENNVKGIVDTEGRRLTCRNLIMEYSYTPRQASAITPSNVSRGILITDKSVKPADSEQITLLTIPPLEGSGTPVQVIEVGYAACAAPRELFLVHLTSRSSDPGVLASDSLKPVVDRFFQTASNGEGLSSKDGDEEDGDERPRILWSLFFTQQDITEIPDEALREGLPGNAYVTAGAGASLGFEHAVKQARRIFDLICPGEEFLPAAPEPDDLVFEDPGQDNPGHSQAGFQQGEEETEKKEAQESADQAKEEDVQEVSGTNQVAPQPEPANDTEGGFQSEQACTNQSAEIAKDSSKSVNTADSTD